MNRKSKKFSFTLKIAVLILLVLVHFVAREPDFLNILTQLLKQYELQDSLIEVGNSFNSVI